MRWSAKSAVALSREMFETHGIRVSDKTVGKLLHKLGCSLQAAKKTVEGKQHPDRNAQFEHIAEHAKRCAERGVPIISVDAKKKELSFRSKRGGSGWAVSATPMRRNSSSLPTQAAFDAAESGQAIILLDEADSLFAKLSEVRSSDDRYANLEVNYLLQRIEAFTGIAILTTNHETAIDPAFMRRLTFHIRVPMPDEDQRVLLWEGMLPERAERLSDLDVSRLASGFAMSGGYIKNTVFRSAFFFSADAGTPISNAHLFRGARAEYEAMGKLVDGGACVR